MGSLDELATYFGSYSTLAMIVLGAVSLVCIGLAIYYFSGGVSPESVSPESVSPESVSPESVSSKSWNLFFGGGFRAALVSVLCFVLVMFLVFLVLGMAGFFSGSSSYSNRSSSYETVEASCDQLLKNQLVFQRGASTAARMQEVIRQIQAQMERCVPEIWNPLVADSVHEDQSLRTPGSLRGARAEVSSSYIGHPGCVFGRLQPEYPLPDGPSSEISAVSSRDPENNIVVRWHPTEIKHRPDDGAICWVYLSRRNQWYGAY